nr:NAC domain-containing protein 83-like [Ipomoea trifida]
MVKWYQCYDVFFFITGRMLCCLIDNLSLLLPGFRFHLTNEELVLHYISPKVLINFPLVAFVILEIDNICKYDPWDLPSTLYGEMNFFSTREVKNDHENRFSRAIGKDKKITISGVLQRLVSWNEENSSVLQRKAFKWF